MHNIFWNNHLQKPLRAQYPRALPHYSTTGIILEYSWNMEYSIIPSLFQFYSIFIPWNIYINHIVIIYYSIYIIAQGGLEYSSQNTIKNICLIINQKGESK